MLDCAKSARTRALVHFLASTGIGPDAVSDPVLRIKHLEKMEGGCYCVTVY